MVNSMKKLILMMFILSVTSVFAQDGAADPAPASVNGHGESATSCPDGDDSARSQTAPVKDEEAEIDPVTGQPVIKS